MAILCWVDHAGVFPVFLPFLPFWVVLNDNFWISGSTNEHVISGSHDCQYATQARSNDDPSRRCNAGSTGRAQLAAVDAAKPDVKETGMGAEPLTDMAFSAEAHLPFCEIWVSDGSATVSEDMRQVLIAACCLGSLSCSLTRAQ